MQRNEPKGKNSWSKTGELLKKKSFGHWKLRKFTLANGILSYGANENSSKKIVLGDCNIQNAESITNRPFTIGIFNPKLKQPLLLQAKDPEDYRQWVEVLEHYANPELKRLNIVSTLEDINDGIIISNEKGLITSINRAAQEMFGYAKYECLGQNVNMFMPKTYKDLHNEFMSRYLQSGENRVMGRSRRVTAMKKDGTNFPIQLSLGEISTNEGVRFVATIRPIVESEVETHKTMVLLEDTKKLLEDKMEALKNTIDFEFIQLRDRILELEEDKKKFKNKSEHLKVQLGMQSKWRTLAESMLTPDQLREVQDSLIDYHQNIEQARITTLLPSEKSKKIPMDFLTSVQLDTLVNWLPEHLSNKDFTLIFSREESRSIPQFYDRLNPNKKTDPEPCLIVIKTTKDLIFGAFLSHKWRKSHQYFGNGDSFLFKLSPSPIKFGWTSNQPPYFMMGLEDEILIGGGSGYGLRLNLEIGWSQHCDTFHNEPLTGNPKEPFSISLFHVYGFEDKKKSSLFKK